MEMRTGTSTAVSHQSDLLSLRNILITAYFNGTQMSVEALKSVIVFYHDIPSVSPLLISGSYNTSCHRCFYCSTGPICQIEPVMHSPYPSKGISPISEARGKPSGGGINK